MVNKVNGKIREFVLNSFVSANSCMKLQKHFLIFVRFFRRNLFISFTSLVINPMKNRTKTLEPTVRHKLGITLDSIIKADIEKNIKATK